MAIKQVHSVAGAIIGENSDGLFKGYVADPLGSIIASIDADGAETGTASYKPFGEVNASTFGLDAPPFLFCGALGYLDEPELGLTYVRSRHYANSLGRWTSVDRIFGNMIPYRYAENNPLKFVDFTGDADTPLDTATLRKISLRQGIINGTMPQITQNRNVGVRFQECVDDAWVAVVGPTTPFNCRPNTSDFSSPERARMTYGRYKAVRPDIVCDTLAVGYGSTPPPCKDSGFIEAKAVNSSRPSKRITISYQDWQGDGFCDVLHRNTSRCNGCPQGFLTYATTSDTIVDPSFYALALSAYNVVLNQRVAYFDLYTGTPVIRFYERGIPLPFVCNYDLPVPPYPTGDPDPPLFDPVP